MKLLITILVCSGIIIYAQDYPKSDWQIKKLSANYYLFDALKDSSNNYYYYILKRVPGCPDSTIIEKRSSEGSLLFSMIDETTKFCLDKSGNFYQYSQHIPFYLRKLSSTGQVIWEKDLSVDYVSISSDENVFVGGRILDQYHLTKYTSDGTLVWDSVIEGIMFVTQILSDQKGNIYINGYDVQYSPEFPISLDRLYKINADGNLVWDKRDNSYQGKRILLDKSENIIAAEGGGIRKYDSSGKEVWRNSVHYFINGLAVDSDNNLIVVGDKSFIDGGNKAYITKISYDGSILWLREYSNRRDYYMSCLIDKNNQYYAVGYSDSGINYISSFVTKYNNNGDEIWSYVVDNSYFGNNRFQTALPTEKGLVLTGNLYSEQNYAGYFIVNVIDPLLTSVGNNNKVQTEYVLEQNFPNPFNPSTTITYQLPKQNKVVIKIFDTLGREVATIVNDEKSAGSYSIVFDGNKLSSGIYFYQLITNQEVLTKKFVLIK